MSKTGGVFHGTFFQGGSACDMPALWKCMRACRLNGAFIFCSWPQRHGADGWSGRLRREPQGAVDRTQVCGAFSRARVQGVKNRSNKEGLPVRAFSVGPSLGARFDMDHGALLPDLRQGWPIGAGPAGFVEAATACVLSLDRSRWRSAEWRVLPAQAGFKETVPAADGPRAWGLNRHPAF